ncbi:phage tail protein [Pseudoduganella lutea]|uniref:Phage tail protein n=1 Tax=Pseudoduganella lutea TaxID=321985 RepID=A0A4P6L790_9BURK|nr:phage tail protein [Pseudoduganella lutea]QBE66838.1 phage tail protein [Pseudoduganella lutea]
MPTATTPTSELDAVNLMLQVIGESPISSLSGPPVVDAVIAQQVLAETLREVQSQGWHFNTEKEYPLVPSFETNEISVPLNTLRVDTIGPDQGIDVVHRGTRLYDRKKHTYEFSRTLKVDLVVLLPFEELPQAARHYITVKAARKFQARAVGSDTLYQFTQADEVEARRIFKKAEGATADHNFLTGTTVTRILQRR